MGSPETKDENDDDGRRSSTSALRHDRAAGRLYFKDAAEAEVVAAARDLALAARADHVARAILIRTKK